MIDTAELVQNVIDGEQNPYEALYLLKKKKKEIEEQIVEIEIEAFSQCEYEDKTFKNNGFEIEKRNGRKVWNFKDVKEWNTYNDARKGCEERLKAAYSAHEKGLNMADENGEVVPLPKVTFTKDSLIIKKV